MQKHTMNTHIAERMLAKLPLNTVDAARLVMECTEELGVEVETLERSSLLRLLRRILRAGVDAIITEEKTVSFETAVQASLNERLERRPSTRRDLQHFVRRMLKLPGVAQRPLRNMSTEECSELLRRAFGASQHSYRKGRAILHSIFACGVRHQWCSSNPVTSINIPPVSEKHITPLSPREVRQLLSTANQPEHRDMLLPLQLMLYCGVRPAEVTRLRPEDICWNDGEVIIRPSVGKTGGGRVIPLRRITPQSTPLKRVAPRNWVQRWRALRRAAGFTHWVNDICRHTFASYHAAHFRNLAVLQLEMGHRDSILLRTRYISPVHRRAAADFWQEVSDTPLP